MADLEKISINDVHENELHIMWAHIISAFMLDNTKQAPIVDIINTEDKKFMMKLHKILTGVDNCLKAIDTSCLFMKRFYGKKYYESKGVSLTDYMTYHYDMICYKTATVKDLYFKLINHLYGLGLCNKECSWDNISSQKTSINNPILFKILNSNYSCLKSIIEVKRNNSAHEGYINDLRLAEMDLYEFFISSKARRYIEELSTIDKIHYELKIKEAKQNLIKEAETIRWISFIITKCVFCSLSDRFAEMISDEIKEIYKLSIDKGIESLSKSKRCPHCNEMGCSFWKHHN